MCGACVRAGRGRTDLHGGAVGDGLVGVDRLVQLLPCAAVSEAFPFPPCAHSHLRRRAAGPRPAATTLAGPTSCARPRCMVRCDAARCVAASLRRCAVARRMVRERCLRTYRRAFSARPGCAWTRRPTPAKAYGDIPRPHGMRTYPTRHGIGACAGRHSKTCDWKGILFGRACACACAAFEMAGEGTRSRHACVCVCARLSDPPAPLPGVSTLVPLFQTPLALTPTHQLLDVAHRQLRVGDHRSNRIHRLRSRGADVARVGEVPAQMWQG